MRTIAVAACAVVCQLLLLSVARADEPLWDKASHRLADPQAYFGKSGNKMWGIFDADGTLRDEHDPYREVPGAGEFVRSLLDKYPQFEVIIATGGRENNVRRVLGVERYGDRVRVITKNSKMATEDWKYSVTRSLANQARSSGATIAMVVENTGLNLVKMNQALSDSGMRTNVASYLVKCQEKKSKSVDSRRLASYEVSDYAGAANRIRNFDVGLWLHRPR